MKHYTGKSIAQKILIVLITLVMLTVSIPKPVQADAGGILISPIVALGTSIVDGLQWVLEWVMLGRPNNFMNVDLKDYESDVIDEKSEHGQITITREEYGKIDGAVLGFDAVNVPDIQYTPENIFTNRIPALDVNFIKPSVTTGDSQVDQKHNIAIQLQPVISSWYVAIRTLAVVGLLSVLVYLGIRILLTSVAADKAKYKKILMDWLVAVILIFALHYIMSLALTAAETLTALINDSLGGDLYITVEADVCAEIDQDVTFKTNLTNYVRFMIQSTDFFKKVGFLFLYLMLVLYNIRFTWTYLKRVVNMAFLTLISPIVALSYPIDKLGDSKAQAFDLWIKEYTFNAILQPLHLLIYTVLLGSATQLAVSNPLYAIVCLGFILAAEKLLKQMFGFNKAGAGTVGSLAGAAGVSALAHKALMGLGKKTQGAGGGKDKVRTNDKYSREGKNEGANKDFQAFDKPDNKGIDLPADAGKDTGNETPPPPSGENKPSFGKEQEDELAELQEYFDNTDNNEAFQNPDEYQAKLDRMKELEEAKKANEAPPQENEDETQDNGEQQEPNTSGSPDPALTGSILKNIGPEPESWSSLRRQDKLAKAKMKEAKKEERKDKFDNFKHRAFTKDGWRQNGVAAYKNIRGAKAGLKSAAYSAARGTLKTAVKTGAALALGATAGVIGATMGDGEKAMAMAGTAAAGGFIGGGNLFESTVGKKLEKQNIKEQAGAAKHGSVIDARNEAADKAYLKSQKHQEEYEKYFKNKMTKQQFDKATKSYRESGITDTKTIRKALKLEQKYLSEGHDGGDKKAIREKVQNIAQGYSDVDSRAFTNKEAKEATIKNYETQLNGIKDAKQRRAVANEIFQGFVDWRNL